MSKKKIGTVFQVWKKYAHDKITAEEGKVTGMEEHINQFHDLCLDS